MPMCLTAQSSTSVTKRQARQHAQGSRLWAAASILARVRLQTCRRPSSLGTYPFQYMAKALDFSCHVCAHCLHVDCPILLEAPDVGCVLDTADRQKSRTFAQSGYLPCSQPDNLKAFSVRCIFMPRKVYGRRCQKHHLSATDP
jgi:hypothetical protein